MMEAVRFKYLADFLMKSAFFYDVLSGLFLGIE